LSFILTVLSLATALFTIQAEHFSGKPGNVREFDSCQGNVRDFTENQGIVRGKNLVRENLPKAVYLNCIFVSIQVFSS